MNVQKGMLYIGEFQHRIFYPTPKSHWLRCPSGETNPALAFAYAPHDHGPFGFGEHPATVYSIPGNVQGLCVTPDGNIALSLPGASAMLRFASTTPPGRTAAAATWWKAITARFIFSTTRRLCRR